MTGRLLEVIDGFFLAPFLAQAYENVVVLDIDDELLFVLRFEQIVVGLW